MFFLGIKKGDKLYPVHDGRFDPDPVAPSMTQDCGVTEDGKIKTAPAADGNKLDKDGDGKDVTVTLTEAEARTNISTGEKLSVMFGKIKKWLADLKAVAFTGSYNDLTNKPTIPTVNNGVLTIKQGGVVKGTFSANSSSPVEINLDAGKVSKVNGKTGEVVLNAEDISVDRDDVYGGETNVDTAINDLYGRISSESGGAYWITFTYNPGLDAWEADYTWQELKDFYDEGIILRGKFNSATSSEPYIIVDYAGIDEHNHHVFYAVVDDEILSVSLTNGGYYPDEVQVTKKPYHQDLTPYRTAAAQDIIDNGKQDVIADLATIRNGAARGATALQSVPATYRTAAEQDDIDAQKQHKLTAGANIIIDQSTNNISAVVPVKSVNSEIGSIYLDATNLKTTIPQPYASVPHEVEIYWDAQTDIGNMTVDGVTATRTNLNEAFSDGVKVNVNITFDGATLLANPIVYGVENDVLYIQCYASGYAYGDGTPVLFWLNAGNSLKSQSGSTLNNPMPLPTGSVYTINDYLIALEARIAALEARQA